MHQFAAKVLAVLHLSLPPSWGRTHRLSHVDAGHLGSPSFTHRCLRAAVLGCAHHLYMEALPERHLTGIPAVHKEAEQGGESQLWTWGLAVQFRAYLYIQGYNHSCYATLHWFVFFYCAHKPEPMGLKTRPYDRGRSCHALLTLEVMLLWAMLHNQL